MSVVGIGTDIVEVGRIEAMAEKARQRLATRVLTPRELDKYASLTHPEQYLAKRWAAKEAASKAIGTGIAAGVSFQDFDIISLPSGQPIIEVSGVAAELAQQQGAEHWHISISDEKHYALAFVVLSK